MGIVSFRPRRKSLRKGQAIAVLAALLVSVIVPLGIRQVQAATIIQMRDYLNRQQADLASAIQHEIFFKAVSTVGGGAGTNKLIIKFPDADDGKWCRTAGTMTVTGITEPTGTGPSESATALPGTLTGACTQGSGSGSVDSNRDLITISGVDNLVSTTNYGVKVVALGGALGTAAAAADNIQVQVKTNNGSTDQDTGTLALSLIAADQIAVTATVSSTLAVSLDTTTAALGTLDTGHVNQAGVVATITTNAGSGYISMVKYNNTLTSGSNTIADTTGGTIPINSEEYGASSSQSGNTITQWSPTSCATTTSTTNATALTTAYKSWASSATVVSAQTATLCFAAGVTVSTAAGSYTSTATVVTTARF